MTSTEIIETGDGGLRIGAGALNADVAAHPVVRRDYPVLAQALLAGASGQLRNMATTGGNLLQRTRCAYFADPTTPCTKRSLDEACSAQGGLGALPRDPRGVPVVHRDAPVGHGGRAGRPGRDGAGAREPDGSAQHPGRRAAPAARRRPDARHRPAPRRPHHRGGPAASPIARNSAYRKVRDRASYAFALVSVAAALEVRDGVVTDVRLALGGVAHKPWRATRAEAALRGAPATDESFRAAARAELVDAEPVESPLGGNAFKLDLVVGALTDTLRRLAATPTRKEAS